MVIIEDKLGRRFEKLRISLLNSCNFSCVYCVGEEAADLPQVEPAKLTSEELLEVNEFTRLIEAVNRLTKLKSIRLTGGEPLLYTNLYPLIDNIRKIGITDIRLTTNASFLKEKCHKIV